MTFIMGDWRHDQDLQRLNGLGHYVCLGEIGVDFMSGKNTVTKLGLIVGLVLGLLTGCASSPIVEKSSTVITNQHLDGIEPFWLNLSQQRGFELSYTANYHSGSDSRIDVFFHSQKKVILESPAAFYG
jgi:hypothetical protein